MPRGDDGRYYCDRDGCDEEAHPPYTWCLTHKREYSRNYMRQLRSEGRDTWLNKRRKASSERGDR